MTPPAGISRSGSPPPRSGGRGLGRRGFLALGGSSLAAVALAACGDDDEDTGTTGQGQTQTGTGGRADVVLDFGTIFGVLNYAYALEQLEAAFYDRVVSEMYSGAPRVERQVFEDLRAHEAVHAAFFEQLLGDNAIPALEPNFDQVDFSDRDSVVQTAVTFENLGVGAYNGAARYIPLDTELGTAPLEAAGDIVAVEARHASIVAAIQEAGRGPAAPRAFDEALPPSQVLQAAQPFIRTTIGAENLPQGG